MDVDNFLAELDEALDDKPSNAKSHTKSLNLTSPIHGKQSAHSQSIRRASSGTISASSASYSSSQPSTISFPSTSTSTSSSSSSSSSTAASHLRNLGHSTPNLSQTSTSSSSQTSSFSRSSQNLQQSSTSASSSASSTTSRNSFTSSSSSSSTTKQLDALLNMIDSQLDLDEPTSALPIRNTSTSSKSSSPPSYTATLTTKCFPVYLTGPTERLKRPCANLFCTKCDFNVLRIEHKSWNDECNYMFFRNNMPDLKKLGVNLLPKQGSAAYCCQCSWINVDNAVNLNSSNALPRWVCSGH